MKDYMNTREWNHQNSDRLLSVEEFKEKQMPPINMRGAIQKNYTEMVEAGVLFRYGRKILIDPDTFWVWLKEKGRKDARI